MQLGGAGADLAKIVEARLGYPIRAIELSLPQRAYSFLTSKVDSDEAIQCGSIAVQKAVEGMTGHMIAIKRVSNKPYKVSYEPVDISLIANVEQKVPQSMMVDDTKMAPSFREYCLPLIQGEIPVKMENGIIKSCVLKRVLVK